MPTNDSLVKILQKLIASGFEVPIILTGIGANGSIVVGEYVSDGSSGVQFNPLAERQMDGGLAEPVNVLIVDARGRATHVVDRGRYSSVPLKRTRYSCTAKRTKS